MIRTLAAALAAEIAGYIEAHVHERDERGHRPTSTAADSTEAAKDQSVAFDLAARWCGMAVSAELLSQLGTGSRCCCRT